MRSPNSFRKAKCKRNQRGGGLGGSIVFSPSSALHTINNPLAVTAGSSCDATSRSLINPSSLGSGGLPGMRGGKRSKRGSRHMKKQRGGGYGFDAQLSSEFMGGSPGNAPYAAVSHVNTGCSSVAIPSSGASGSLNVPVTGPGALLQKGGKRAGLGESNLALTVPTAGVTVNPPGVAPIVSASGALLSVNVPYDARAYNPSCLQTNPQSGGRRKTRKTKGKKSRKTRKAGKKSRKH
jgi:hypothetical protein